MQTSGPIESKTWVSGPTGYFDYWSKSQCLGKETWGEPKALIGPQLFCYQVSVACVEILASEFAKLGMSK